MPKLEVRIEVSGVCLSAEDLEKLRKMAEKNVQEMAEYICVRTGDPINGPYTKELQYEDKFTYVPAGTAEWNALLTRAGLSGDVIGKSFTVKTKKREEFGANCEPFEFVATVLDCEINRQYGIKLDIKSVEKDGVAINQLEYSFDRSKWYAEHHEKMRTPHQEEVWEVASITPVPE